MIKKSIAYKLFTVFNTIMMLFVIAITLYPMLYILSVSLSSSHFISTGQVAFYPKGFQLMAYKELIENSMFWISYKNTVIYTVSSVLIQLFMTIILAYPLSKKGLMGKKFLMPFITFTMFFQGGLIPNYLLIRELGMKNTIWAIVIPGAIATYNMIIMKTFFEGLPQELEEAAAIDGMNTYSILWKIVLPLSKPILATMVLFYAVGAWNSWFSAMIYLDEKEMQPVTLYLRNILVDIVDPAAASMDASDMQKVAESMKSASIILVTLPILCVYPFVQKYFVKGVMVGSLKA